jgi:hypothetical protein
MKFALDDYIDEYIKEAGDNDKTAARHLKEIIPQTAHLNRETFKEIIEELKKEMDNGNDFKTAFKKVCEKFILKGDIIEAELPDILTRIILNKSRFISYVKKKSRIPYKEKEIEIILASKKKELIIALLGRIKLSKRKVVFATFDQGNKEGNPFLNAKVIDIINMLALDKNTFEEDEPFTAIKIRYKNSGDYDNRYPTFIDSGWYDKFYPAGKNDNYGRTRSLDPSLPDMPEIVHINLKMTGIIEDVRFLQDKK